MLLPCYVLPGSVFCIMSCCVLIGWFANKLSRNTVLSQQKCHRICLTAVNFHLGRSKPCTEAIGDSRVTKVIRVNVVLEAYNPLEGSVEIVTETGWIGVAGVADLCQTPNDETSAYSKRLIPCRLCHCCGDSFLLTAYFSKHYDSLWKAGKDATQWKIFLGTPSCCCWKHASFDNTLPMGLLFPDSYCSRFSLSLMKKSLTFCCCVLKIFCCF